MTVGCWIDIQDTKTGEIERVAGTYSDIGQVVTNYANRPLEINPDCFHPDDPKLFFRSDKNCWTRFRLQSLMLDSKEIAKTW